MKRHARVLSWLGVASLVLVGCGDDSARDGGVGGDAATSSDGSAGAGAPTSPGSTSSGGAGGSTGTSSSPTSGASSGGSSAQSSGAGGGPPTPCGGGADMSGTSGSSHWISSDPPDYGRNLAQTFGPGGTFQVQLTVSPRIGDIDCRSTPCVIATRADHTRSSDRSADVFVPVTFKEKK